MSVHWDDYQPYESLRQGRPNDLLRREARQEYGHVMAARSDREQVLADLLRRNGVVLSWDDDGVQAVDDWFTRNVTRADDVPDRLAGRWYAVATDIGLFLGDLLIMRCPWLRWEFQTYLPRSLSYRWAVVVGFRVNNPKYCVEFRQDVAGWGQVVSGRRVRESGHLLTRLHSAEFYASGVSPRPVEACW